MRVTLAAAILSSVSGWLALAPIEPLTTPAPLTVQDDDRPSHILERNGKWKSVMLNVARAGVVNDHSFHSAMMYWASGYLAGGSWAVRADGDLKTAQSFANAGARQNDCANVQIGGDCLADVTVEGSALILIRGNLRAKVTVRDHSEVIIGGSILEGGSIEASGIASTYVGGDVLGSVRALGGQTLWVDGSVKGRIEFSRNLRAHIARDCVGHLDVGGGLTSLSLDVGGYMPQETLIETARRVNPVFKASVGLGDLASGLFSDEPGKVWVVSETASPEYIQATLEK